MSQENNSIPDDTAYKALLDLAPKTKRNELERIFLKNKHILSNEDDPLFAVLIALNIHYGFIQDIPEKLKDFSEALDKNYISFCTLVEESGRVYRDKADRFSNDIFSLDSSIKFLFRSIMGVKILFSATLVLLTLLIGLTSLNLWLIFKEPKEPQTSKQQQLKASIRKIHDKLRSTDSNP